MISYILKFLASPVRVFASLNRFMILAIAAGSCFLFGVKILPFVTVVFVVPSTMLFTLAVYGSDEMIRRNVPWKTWLWRHVEVWWVNPDEVP